MIDRRDVTSTTDGLRKKASGTRVSVQSRSFHVSPISEASRTLYHPSQVGIAPARENESEVSTTQGGVSMRAFGRLAAASVLLFAAAGAVAFATVIYVNAAATGANNGSSW